MSIFIDAGIFIAYLNKKDSHHSKATDLIDDIMDKDIPKFMILMVDLMGSLQGLGIET